jgi:hypothetical protein
VHFRKPPASKARREKGIGMSLKWMTAAKVGKKRQNNGQKDVLIPKPHQTVSVL